VSDEVLARKRILLVDDEPALLGGLGCVLRRRRGSWQVDAAVGGRAALDEMARGSFDAVVTDLRMPEVDGVEVLRSASFLQPRAARIVFSAETDLAEVLPAVLHAHRYLTKPCPAGELEAVIDECLAATHCQPGSRLWARALAASALVPTPQTRHALERLSVRPDVTAAQLARVIEQDAALSAKVLHVANAALCAGAGIITSVTAAVQELGPATLRQMVATLDPTETSMSPTTARATAARLRAIA
jgi:DNA-binding NtrC family response regulator